MTLPGKFIKELFNVVMVNGICFGSSNPYSKHPRYRMLMYNGYPQIYGTQFTDDPKTFHEIKDIKNVNERRKKVGLCPIEQKARSSGIYFEWSDYQTNKHK